jgi:hypothetical protein
MSDPEMAAPVRAGRRDRATPNKHIIDCSHVKAHRTAAGAERGEQAIGRRRSQGGCTSKIHYVADDCGRPAASTLTSGNIADLLRLAVNQQHCKTLLLVNSAIQ